MRTRIKFCGLVEAADVDAAVALAVDAIGLVFYPRSARFLSLDDAQVLRRRIPSHLRCVGLFVNEPCETVQRHRDQLGLDLIQFHGDETVGQCEQAAGKTPYWRAVRMRGRNDLLESKAQFPSAEALLLDTFSAAYGGSGQPFDWSWVDAQSKLPYVMSGGLTVANVASAIAAVAPWYVDVSSGIQTEGNPRRKDHAKMSQFVEQVLQQDAR